MASLSYDTPVETIDGVQTDLSDFRDKAILVVNVASKCGLTPQYAQLEDLQKEYEDRGFTVVGFPSNQFNGQEPGSNDEIAEFCSATYGVTFPMFAKIDVNGEDRHPLYTELVDSPYTANDELETGDILWNFEKFLIAPGGAIVGRFAPRMTPDDPAVVSAIEAVLPL